jgi:hypothetical protein
MIIVARKTPELEVPLSVGVKGHFRLYTRKAGTGEITQDTGWFENTILDSGRNGMAQQANWLTYCHVGTDNTASNPLQTTLGGFQAASNDITDTVVGATASAPYYGYKRLTFLFQPGTAAANLSEVGVGWGASGSTLVSRALIIDPQTQNPTTVTPLADEYLYVVYEFRQYAPTVDVVGPQVTLDGVVYDTTTRAAEATSEYWYNGIGLQVADLVDDVWDWSAYDGEPGTIAQNPSGSAASSGTTTTNLGTYSNNSYERTIGMSVSPTAWVLGAGIRSMRIRTTLGSFQTRFGAAVGDATIPKTSAYTMVLTWKVSWTEYTG